MDGPRRIQAKAAPAEGAAPQSPASEPAGPAQALPEIAKKADDLEAIKKAVDDAASVSGALWFSYLFVLFYLAVAAGAVTHADLFFEHPVKLPFLGIELPLLAFFFLTPILFIIMHAYTLVHLVMLTEKAKRFHRALNAPQSNVSDEKRENLQWQLPSNIFIQFLVGPRGIRGGLFGVALRAIAWITLVIAPVLLLLMMQLQFLPFHSLFITWTQRIALLVDLILLAWLWRKVLSGHELGGRFRASWAWPVLGLALSFGAILFSWTVATFPGEWQEDRLATWRFAPVSDASQQANDNPSEPQRMSLSDWTTTIRDWAAPVGNWLLTKGASLHDTILNSEVDDTTRRRRLPFSNTLVLIGFNVLEGLGIDDPKKAEWRDFVFRARGRDLKGAIFDFANFPKVDFTGAELHGASLYKAQLKGASLFGAQLQGAFLDEAQLQAAWLYSAQLQGASLKHAQLQGASLDSAQLQGASLSGAELQGAFLHSAVLRATDLSNALLWRSNSRSPMIVKDYDVSELAAPRTPIFAVAFAAVKLPDAPNTWSPIWRGLEAQRRLDEPKTLPWNVEAYQGLRQSLEVLPPGNLRIYALDRIRSLDCSISDKTLASCDPSVPPPREADAWRKALEGARAADDAAYAKALVAVLGELVCSGGDDAIAVLRGLVGYLRFRSGRIFAAGPEAPTLVDFIMSEKCPISASLTGDERATLLSIKQGAIRKPGG